MNGTIFTHPFTPKGAATRPITSRLLGGALAAGLARDFTSRATVGESFAPLPVQWASRSPSRRKLSRPAGAFGS